MASETTLYLTISSVSENLFDGAAISVTLPAVGGEVTVLPNHEPLVTTLKAGTIVVRPPNSEPKEFVIVSGVLEISGTRAVVLV